MSEVTRVVVDAMGGDYAPEWIIRGAVEAINEGAKAQIILTGKEDVIKKELAKYTYDQSKIEVLNATEEITCHEAPVQAVRSKKDSSLVVGLNMVKNGEADAIISAGSSGAILAGGQLVVGRSKGVKRSPLAPLLPTSKGYSLLIDCGANVDARPEHLLQFAKMLLGEIKNTIMSSFKTKIGGLLIKSSLNGLKERFNAKNKGGAPLLGLQGLVVKIHGNSHNEEVKSAIFQCINFKENGVNEKIAENIGKEVAK